VGETGTGKELAAQLVHARSARAGQPFVVVHCGGLSPLLVESELFGHKAGSFTGADRDRVGLVDAAAGGTLFLDEIATMTPEAQIRLLRFLQSKEARPVGATQSHVVDVRVVAATNQDLWKLVPHQFREDLFYRLRVAEVVLPPLRARPGDVELLAEHFLAAGCRGCLAPCGEKRLTADALAALARHRWPGNVRELENALAAVAAVCDGGPVDVPELAAVVGMGLAETVTG